MAKLKDIFLADSKIAFDKKHRKTINFNISKYHEAVKKGKLRYSNLDLAKERASFLKGKVVANLAKYIEEFEKNAKKNGIEIIWARNGKEAVSEIIKILKKVDAKLVVKSKSMISEEIELNNEIEKVNVEPVETDLGEFIVQVAGEKPYHILTPAMHKSKEDVAKLFNEKFETPPDSSPEELTLFVRKKLRKKFTSAEIGITGANFLIADVGGVALTENEGNGFMSLAFPKVHIVITGLEKILPSIKHLPLFFPMLSTLGTGQQVTVYNSLLTGPKKYNEINGPEKMVVVLLDNGRTDIAQEKEHSQALKCVRCGACLNACPIYKNVGGYTYNTTYSGPIGAVITPFFQGFDKYNHLSFACTVCGACSEVCPVKIPLHNLLLLNRKKSVDGKLGSWAWNTGMKAFEMALKKRKNLDAVNGKVKNMAVKANKNILGKEKEFPVFSKNSFSKNWKLNLK
ncbi:MAG: lactate utilization protein [Prolixibacteraceae bacterium]|jgi:L-lactate dehydrogenase complex protein LldF|nr:lactate utilization protein [Prolixibacteraceae bacterium]MBT6766230.1 lactate utilization protein [Prolixibacteraceae bacterium]MBT7000560.1 lactate utilization protein [Prolixibacteraceae bacterium]MBT7393508.1 lactate utilization protein [Prolixibacteraceae bacterium]